MRREETVDYNIRATWQAIARMYNQQAARYGATMSTGFVLLNINSEEGTPAPKIAPLMGLEARSLTRIWTRLEEAKMIYRQTDKSDKRLVRIFLTKEGKVKKEKAREVVLLFNEKIREEIAPEKLNIFFDVLTDINKIIDQNNMFDKLAV